MIGEIADCQIEAAADLVTGLPDLSRRLDSPEHG